MPRHCAYFAPMKTLIASLAALVLLSGCGLQLTDLDKRWVPYTDKPTTLIFQNEKGNQFHLYLLGVRKDRDHVSRSFRTEPSLLVFASSYEGAKIRRKDKPPTLLRLTRGSINAPALLQVSLTDYRYQARFNQQDTLTGQFETLGQTFDDVIRLKNERPIVKEATTHQATYVYWSRKKGLLGFELDNGSKFKLIRIEDTEGN